MPNERRIKRLEQLLLEVAAETIHREVRDPRLGLPSILRVKLAPDLGQATVYWSTLEEGGRRRRVAAALESALPLVQRRIAEAMTTRVTPILTLRFDPTLERAQRLEEIFHHLREERGEVPGETEGDVADGADDIPDAGADEGAHEDAGEEVPDEGPPDEQARPAD